MNPFLLILSVLPGVIISYVVFRVDKYEREPLVPLVVCFLGGGLLTIPAICVEQWAFESLHATGSARFGNMLVLAYGAVAFNEEFLKFAGLMCLAFPWRFFNEPLDGIVYAVLIAMGFATMENINYADRFGAGTVVLRTFTAVPVHLVLAIVQGYYVGIAKFDTRRRYYILLQGFALAVILHGTYDFLIFQDWSDWLFVLATLSLYLCLFLGMTLIKRHLDNSPFRKRF